MNRIRLGIIYKVTNRINGKIYIGKTNCTFSNRKSNHLGEVRRGKKNKFYNAVRKYGVNNFEWEVISEGYCTNEYLSKLETYYISLFGSFINGYNMTLGGEGTPGLIPSKELKIKRLAVLRTPEAKENHRQSMQGEGNPMYGVTMSIESRKKMSEAKKGRKATKEQKELLYKYSKGRVWTEEQKENKSKSQPTRKSIIGINEKTGHIVQFDCIKEAQRALNYCNDSNIVSCLKGRRRKAAGYIWKYKESTQYGK